MEKMRRVAASVPLAFALVSQTLVGQIAGQVPLSPMVIPQFVDPLPHFAAGLRVNARQGGNLTVKMVPHTQVAVSTGTKLATGTVGVTPGVGFANLWVYRISTDGTNFTPPLWPAFTIEAERDPLGGKALRVTYQNELIGAKYQDVGLVVDQTLHWADPLMQMPQMTPYTGDVPAVVHLHGGEVPPHSDGGPDAWFTPGNVKTGHAFNPNPYLYPNTQEAATLWYHDHALGATRLNVYAGMAGFYFLRDPQEDNLTLPGWSGDGMVQEVAPPGASGVFNAAPYKPEIEVAIQDRMFDNTGKLYFPNLPTNPAVHPYWTPEFLGDVITVNGKTWPYLSVAPRRYRFRILNGSNARFYNMSFPKGGPRITQIGTDGGFLDAPVPLGNGPLLLAPGERADVIIDFTPFAPVPTKKGAKVSSFTLTNDARAPFPGGKTVNGLTTGRIMQFVVNGLKVGTGTDLPANYASLKTNEKLTDFAGNPIAGLAVARTRQLTLNEVMGAGGPLEVLVNNTKWNGMAFGTAIRPEFKPVSMGNGMFAYYSESVDEGSTEVWQIINLTADAHPMHLHLVQFQLMSRQPFDVKRYTAAYSAAFPGGMMMDAYGPPLSYVADQRLPGEPIETIGGNPNVKPFLLAPARGASTNEKGWKDTFIMYPGEVTTVIVRWAPTDKPATAAANTLYFDFDPSGGHGYVWHCHIVDHEDNEMMRPYDVVANPAAARNALFTPVASARPRLREDASGEQAPGLPSDFHLQQNYPNPFNPTTEIRFGLPEATHVRLTLYNALGQEIQTLLDQDAPAGNHTVRVDATSLAGGTYFYRLQAGGHSAIKKMLLVK